MRGSSVEEVILATSPTVEGEATAPYLARVLRPAGIRYPDSLGVPSRFRPRMGR